MWQKQLHTWRLENYKKTKSRRHAMPSPIAAHFARALLSVAFHLLYHFSLCVVWPRERGREIGGEGAANYKQIIAAR